MNTPNLKVYSFEEAFSFQSLLDAHQRCRRNKNHKREVVDFELNLTQNIIKLSNAILNGTYEIPCYRNFVIFEPKKRNIESLGYRHRLVQAVLCKKILEPVLERHIIQTNCACRCSKGTGYARDMFELYLHKMAKKKKSNAYFLKCDVRKYFASIDHEILIQKLAKAGFETKAFNLIKLIINSHNQNTGVGIPIGNQTSQWFALFYLDEVDRLIKEKLRLKYYVRYMDDLVIIGDDLEYLKFCKREIIKKGEKLKLSFNKKTQIRSFKTGVSFIGHLYKVNESGKVFKLLKYDTKKRVKDNFKRMSFFYEQNLLDKSVIYDKVTCYKNYYNSFYGKNFISGLIKKHNLEDCLKK